MIFWLILTSVPLATIGWWASSHFAARKLKRIVSPAARLMLHLLIAGFFVTALGTFAWIIGERMADWPSPPPLLHTFVFVWFIAGLPASVLAIASLVLALAINRKRPSLPQGSGTPASRDQLLVAGLSRREFLAASVVVAPPIATGILTIKARVDANTIRTRAITIPIADLAPELSGMTIAHVSDTHIGRYAQAPRVARIVQQTNDLRCDVICVTGDILDFNLDLLPDAIAMLRGLFAPGGVVVCEGNHDLFVSPARFRGELKAAGINLLVNESATRTIRGVPVEFSGLRWGIPGAQTRAAGYMENFAELAMSLPGELQSAHASTPQARRASGLPLLRLHLAHHPHAFDPAAAAGVDLTLAGHTHGGQINLLPGIGPASFIYKYVSGHYTQPMAGTGRLAHSVISNGTGNWFPLRMSAPAEIVHITLVRV